MKKINDVREGVWILAVLAFATALSLVAMGLQMFSLSDVFRGSAGLPLADPTTGAVAGSINSGMFFGIGLALVALAFLSYFVGKGMLKAKKWARVVIGIVAIIILAIAVVLMVNSYYAIGISGMIIAGLQIWYLFFKKSSKKYFK